MTRYRTLWLFDIHRGTRSSRADELLHFLEGVSAERIYLVGDIVDLLTPAGKKLLVIHGDILDERIRAGTNLEKFDAAAYFVIRQVDASLPSMRRGEGTTASYAVIFTNQSSAILMARSDGRAHWESLVTPDYAG